MPAKLQVGIANPTCDFFSIGDVNAHADSAPGNFGRREWDRAPENRIERRKRRS